ncbi:MAG: hypothetical protein ACPG7F_00140 [Aggregatilineales bacterium]
MAQDFLEYRYNPIPPYIRETGIFVRARNPLLIPPLVLLTVRNCYIPGWDEYDQMCAIAFLTPEMAIALSMRLEHCANNMDNDETYGDTFYERSFRADDLLPPARVNLYTLYEEDGASAVLALHNYYPTKKLYAAAEMTSAQCHKVAAALKAAGDYAMDAHIARVWEQAG